MDEVALGKEDTQSGNSLSDQLESIHSKILSAAKAGDIRGLDESLASWKQLGEPKADDINVSELAFPRELRFMWRACLIAPIVSHCFFEPAPP